MGAFVSLAFRWHGTLEQLSSLDGAFESAGLAFVHGGELAEGQSLSTWMLSIDGEREKVTRRCYGEGRYVSTTIDIEEERFDVLAQRIGRHRLIERFVKLGCELLRVLKLSYVFFEEEAEADLDPETFDGTRLFGISIVPDNAPWLDNALGREDIQRVERLPGAVVIYRRTDPVPHLG